jgi:hypothetical protein
MLADSVDELSDTVGVVAPTDSDVVFGRFAPRHPAATAMRDKATTVIATRKGKPAARGTERREI